MVEAAKVRTTSFFGGGRMAIIRVADQDEIYAFDFEDLLKFHGTRAICGLTVALKIMEAAWTKCWPDTPPDRSKILVQSGFPGPGTRDGFELVTRAQSRQKYIVLDDPPKGGLIAEAAKGSYYFRISDAETTVELGLRPEVVPDDFVSRRRHLQSGGATAEDAKLFRQMQFDFSEQLRSLDPLDAVNVLSVEGP